jgi:hypothetical protein
MPAQPSLDERPWRRYAGCLTRTTLLALTAAWVVACDDGRTYYPVKLCNKQLCDNVNARGKTHKRFAVALGWEQYTAVPEQQDVMLATGLGVTSLTKDEHLECRVADQRNWQCVGSFDEPDFIPEGYFMRDGELSHSERSRLGDMGDEAIDYTRWCDWQQVSWHTATSDKDDTPASREPVLPLLLAGVVYWVTGCWL